MPLPDERPRPSVANLIGKFETQTKRLSLSASSPSRSSSVVSHITGDSTKDEIKEKREWPPKSVTDFALKQSQVVSSFAPRHIPAPLITSSTSAEKKDGVGSQVAELEVPLTAKALNASQMQAKADSSSFLENWRKDLPSSEVDMEPEVTPTTATPPAPQPSLVTPTPLAVKKLGVLPTPRTPNSASKGVPPKMSSSTPSKPVASSVSSKTPVKTSLTSTASKQSLSSSIVSPLRPQHTGQSGVSSASTRKPVTRAPAPPKTPSRSESASRAKTPTSSRPKTPSTGLFAPTAASLARSRNPPPPMPTPVKKTTLSTSAMDRLSKPTAASQARMAASASTVTPASRPAATNATQPATAKAKPATTPRKEKKDLMPAASTAAVVASVASIGLTVTAVKEDTEKPVEDLTMSVESANPSSSSPLASALAPDGSEEIQKGVQVQENAHVDPPVDFESVGSAENDVTPMSPSPIPRAGQIDAETEAAAAADSGIELGEPTVTIASNGKNDLEDIVNLLESVSITKPLKDTFDNIPAELLEIPDEDEK